MAKQVLAASLWYHASFQRPSEQLLKQLSRQLRRFVAFFFIFFFFFWVGELYITHTWTCNERNHKYQTEGHPQPKLQATLTTWVEAHTKVCKAATCQAKQAAHKAVVHHPTAKPVHLQQTKHHLCLNQPNIAVKITSIMKCQAKQAADKTVSHHQYAKLASFHQTKGKLMPRSTQVCGISSAGQPQR